MTTRSVDFTNERILWALWVPCTCRTQRLTPVELAHRFSQRCLRRTAVTADVAPWPVLDNDSTSDETITCPKTESRSVTR